MISTIRTISFADSASSRIGAASNGFSNDSRRELPSSLLLRDSVGASTLAAGTSS
jgi:hypothetical protein